MRRGLLLLLALASFGACRDAVVSKTSAPDVSSLAPMSTGVASASSSAPVGALPTAAGTTEGPSGATADASTPIALRTPKKHRAAATACSQERAPVSPKAGDHSEYASCSKDADCKDGKNGRCGPNGRRWGCSYDECRTDAECENKGVCECRTTDKAANKCKAGNCRTDADCKGTYCSPSLGSCGHMFGTVGFFCHTPKDECNDDDDCPGKIPDSCRYIPEAGAFKCSHGECKG